MSWLAKRATYSILFSLPLHEPIITILFSIVVATYQENRLLASASDDGTIKIWELASIT